MAGHLRNASRQQGFSLLELLVVMGILSVVCGMALTLTNHMVRTNANVTNTTDMVQQGRQFMGQISSDIHNSGYPSRRMFDPSGSPAASQYAAGLVSVTQNSMQFEGDVDGSGNVSVVYLQLVVPAGGCPCTMQRGTVYKSLGSATPPYYTEVTGVMNTNVFSAYYNDGSSVLLPASATDLPAIKSIFINLQLQSQRTDVPNGQYSVVTLSTEAKINN